MIMNIMTKSMSTYCLNLPRITSGLGYHALRPLHKDPLADTRLGRAVQNPQEKRLALTCPKCSRLACVQCKVDVHLSTSINNKLIVLCSLSSMRQTGDADPTAVLLTALITAVESRERRKGCHGTQRKFQIESVSTPQVLRGSPALPMFVL